MASSACSSLSAGISCHGSRPYSLTCASASIFSSRSRSWARVCRRNGPSKYDLSGSDRLAGFWVLPTARRNFLGGCLREIVVVAASSGNNNNGKRPHGGGSNRGRGGKGKANPERKDDGKKDNGWNAGIRIDKTSKSLPNKKQAKPNVWSAEFSSGKSPELKEEKESSRDGGRGRARAKVVDQGRDERQQSSNAAPSNVPAPERRESQQQLEGVDDTLFLRYLSPLLPIEEEKLLQPEEAVPNPLFSTFCSNSAGVWRGVGATFSPITGEFEPIYLDENKQDVYDVRVLSTVENLRTSNDGALLPPEQQSLLRKLSWSLQNSLTDDHGQGCDDGVPSEESVIYEEVDEQGYWEDDEGSEDDEENTDWEFVLADPGEIDERWEKGEEVEGSMKEIEDTDSVREDLTDVLDWEWEGGSFPADESGGNLTTEDTTSTTNPVGRSYDDGFTDDTSWSDIIEEDVMALEPGLVFFEEGAYSRGPFELLADASSSSREYFNAYTFKIEQCLVAGGHRRLRIVHTVSIEAETEKLEVLRLAVYEEEWMGPCNMKSISDAGGHQLKLFSERARHSPEDVLGKWKVFEIEGTAMHPAKPNESVSLVFYCKESSIKRGFPTLPELSIQEDESVDLSDFSMSWLTGNVSTYVSVGDTGTLTFGVGWVCDDGTRLVMERAYREDGKLLRVNSKSELRIGG